VGNSTEKNEAARSYNLQTTNLRAALFRAYNNVAKK